MPKKEVSQTAGWLSPNGDFYPCESSEHDLIGMRLCETYYGITEGGIEKLEKENWLRISITGRVTTDDPHACANKKQINKLADILCSGENKKYIMHMKRSIEKLMDNSKD